MFIDTTKKTKNGKTYVSHALRTSYRENGKVKHKTIMTLPKDLTDEEVEAFKLALKHKKDLNEVFPLKDLEIQQGKSFGALWVIIQMAKRTGLYKILGKSHNGALALYQIAIRLMEQGSRLSALKHAQFQAVKELLSVGELTKDQLYRNLTWVSDHQEEIEKKLFHERCIKKGKRPSLFLYDVTSSYFEGTQNVYSKYGYNRDKKKGKSQIVIGLLTDDEGYPLAVRIFDGNTVDTQTVEEQIRTLSEVFKVKHVTLVGDRGMIKMPQIENFPEGFKYITAISKPTIQTLINQGFFDRTLFDKTIKEVESDGIRYILKCNPLRMEEIQKSRKERFEVLVKKTNELNLYLKEHKKAQFECAKNHIIAKAKKLLIHSFVDVVKDHANRTITVQINQERLDKESELDGCYVLKTNVNRETANAQTIHDRYKDLAKVERAFKQLKTETLEIRPIFVRNESSTKGHVFVCMLAYLIQKEMEQFLTGSIQEHLDSLKLVTLTTLSVKNMSLVKILKPSLHNQEILNRLNLSMPEFLPCVQEVKR